MTKIPIDFFVNKKKQETKPKKVKMISDPKKGDVSYSVIRYDKTGNQTDTDKYVCSVISHNEKLSYTVLVQHNSLYDNKNPLPRKREYKSVNKKCFDQYMKYLKTGVQSDYDKAFRSYLGTR